MVDCVRKKSFVLFKHCILNVSPGLLSCLYPRLDLNKELSLQRGDGDFYFLFLS